MSIELKPCPFCGVKPDVFQDNIRTWGLLKHKEQCLFPCFVNHEIPESDFEAWNTRAERTCQRVFYKPTGVFVCSECGAGIPTQLDKYCYLHYCPNCGAKVVKE